MGMKKGFNEKTDDNEARKGKARRPGAMWGRPVGREGELRNPGRTESEAWGQDPRALRPGGERDLLHEWQEPYEEQTEDMEDPEL